MYMIHVFLIILVLVGYLRLMKVVGHVVCGHSAAHATVVIMSAFNGVTELFLVRSFSSFRVRIFSPCPFPHSPPGVVTVTIAFISRFDNL